jgi:hypothetical protein
MHCRPLAQTIPAPNLSHDLSLEEPVGCELYGPVAIREIEGGATECMFGQQRDEKRARVPDYDLCFLR